MAKVLVIPGSYKSTITSSMAADIIVQQYKELRPYDLVQQVFISDGGEGTLEAFLRNFGGKNHYYMVHGMRGESIVANTLWLDSTTVVIESSSVVGYSLIPMSEKNPWKLTSFGIGELILLVKKDGAKVVFVTMGDSLIMDLGIGMLRAIGVEFYDEKRRLLEVSELSAIEKIQTINVSNMNDFSEIKFFALVDTKDYLLGKYGQINVYGKQKGLCSGQEEIVGRGYKNYVRIIHDMFGIDLASLPMATGSGGLAASLYAFLNAELIHCPLYIAERINLKSLIEDADILITGEGFLDNQTRWGKIPYFVSREFKGHIFLIVGDYSNEGVQDIRDSLHTTIHIIKLNKGVSTIEAMAEASVRICKEMENILN